MKSYTFWLKAAAVVQLITGAIHSVSFFVEPEERTTPSDNCSVFWTDTSSIWARDFTGRLATC